MKNGVMFLSYTGKRVEKQWPIYTTYPEQCLDILEVEFLHIYILYTKITKTKGKAFSIFLYLFIYLNSLLNNSNVRPRIRISKLS